MKRGGKGRKGKEGREVKVMGKNRIGEVRRGAISHFLFYNLTIIMLQID